MMHTFLFFVLLGYALFLLGIGFYDRKKIVSYSDYVIAGKKQKFFAVFMSLMATIIGASTTLGLASKAEQIGFPASWWLLSGAVGLGLQAVFISRKLRSYAVCTLPELVKVTVNEKSQKLVSAIIAISWLGIIAAQFSAIAQILAGVLGIHNSELILWACGGFVMIYTLLGGQLSVVRTDMLQFLILFLGFASILVLIYFRLDSGTELNPLRLDNILLFNAQFHWYDALMMLFTVGGAYFLGPDILTRNMIARDGKTAQKAVFAGSIAVVLFAFIITGIGMAARVIAPGEGNPLIRLIWGNLPVPLAVVLILAIVSALLSSADTCLINSSAIIAQDLLKRKDILSVKITIALVSVLAIVIAGYGKDIIALLLGAYSIYTPGVVCPLAVAVLRPAGYRLRENVWLAAVACGGGLGVLSKLLPQLPGVVFLPLIGMLLSAVIAVGALAKKAR